MFSNVSIFGTIVQMPERKQNLANNYHGDQLMYICVYLDYLKKNSITIPVRLWIGDANYIKENSEVGTEITVWGHLDAFMKTDSDINYCIFMEKFKLH
ncbi:MAG: hypothetical protein J6P61_08395 [Erysipelotrichaceae bacterium]|nr:hypothetical protein [Erysipelotrichaceae bacterium]